MTDALPLLLDCLLAGTVGLVTGWAFYGGLWLTTRQLPGRSRPWLWLSLSLVLRFTATALVFVLLARTLPLPAVLTAAALFLLPRHFWLRRVRRPETEGSPS